MPRARRTLRAFVSVLLSTLVVPVLPAVARAEPPRYHTGTYELLAKDRLTPGGELEHTYTEVLRVPGRKAIPLRLARGHGLTAGTRIRVAAQPAPSSQTGFTSYERIAPASTIGSPGTTSVLVILAYWTAPDSMTQSRAATQFFTDDDKWFREVSYGQAGLAGVATPWVRIPGPWGGRCYDDAENILGQATNAARGLGAKYDSVYYQRVVLYFPRCTGSDTTGVAGWAYEPGSVSWLNGHLDRRTTVHEQGHNYGIGHAKALTCRTSAGTPLTFGPRCTTAEYGDPFDAMGRSSYAAHFTGYRKDRLGWLGSRKRVVRTSSATFTLPPFERPSSLPVVVVVRSAKVAARAYWLEYRRPVGMDARLPGGATGGVLVHVQDNGRPGLLLDGTPGDRTLSTAVLKAGTRWTAPDGVRFAIGTATSTGIRVSVSGARVAATPPGVPRYLSATAGDTTATVSWQPPASDGGEPVLDYLVSARATSGHTVTVTNAASLRTATLHGLLNDETYTVTVRARNVAGRGAAATTYALPRELRPSGRILSPGAGELLTGRVTVRIGVAANPVTEVPIDCVHLYVDDQLSGAGCGYPDDVVTVDLGWYTGDVPDGDHVLSAVVFDRNGRAAAVAPVTVRTDNPVPDVAVVSPANGTAHADVETIAVDVSATVDHPDIVVENVVVFDVTDGRDVFVGAAHPVSAGLYRMEWNVAHVSGSRTIVAVAYTPSGHRTRSAPVSLEIAHPPATVTLTAPASNASVRGPSVRLTADAVSHAARSPIASVSFYVDGHHVWTDTTAPFEAAWDTSNVTGRHSAYAIARETSGRTTQSAGAAFDVANVLPVARITAPAQGDYARPGDAETVRGYAVAGEGGERPDRVLVNHPYGSVTVPVAEDGSWSMPYDHRHSWTWHRIEVRAVTPEGLRSAPHVVSFYLQRPRPTAALESPTTVPQSSNQTVVVTAQAGAGDPATVREVCFVVSSWGYVGCDSTPDADGRYRIPWSVTQSQGTYTTSIAVILGDGTSWGIASASVTVTAPA